MKTAKFSLDSGQGLCRIGIKACMPANKTKFWINFNGKSPNQYLYPYPYFSLTGSVWKVRGFCWEVLQLSSSALAAGCFYCTISLSTSFRELKVIIPSVWHWHDIVSSNACGDVQEGFAWGSWVPRPVCGQGQAFGIGEKSCSNNHEHKS